MESRDIVETVWDFIFLGSTITVDSDCSHEIKSPLLLGRKAMTNLEAEATFCQQSLCSQSYGFFPVVMYGCEAWPIKKADHQRIDAFETMAL